MRLCFGPVLVDGEWRMPDAVCHVEEIHPLRYRPWKDRYYIQYNDLYLFACLVFRITTIFGGDEISHPRPARAVPRAPAQPPTQQRIV